MYKKAKDSNIVSFLAQTRILVEVENVRMHDIINVELVKQSYCVSVRCMI